VGNGARADDGTGVLTSVSDTAGDPARHRISRLRISDSEGIQELLVRYAPQLVVLPEDIDRDGQPGPRTEHDYHPRSARMFVDIARTVALDGQASPRMWRLSATMGRTLELLDVTKVLALILLAALGAGAIVDREPGLLIGGVIVAGSLLVLGALGDRADRRKLPRLGGKAARRRLERVWPERLRLERLTLPGRVDGRSTWRLYRRLVTSRAVRYPRTVYGRTVQAGELVAVQYWLFFFYNPWHNLHEADWELVTVLHDPRADRPQSVCASAHGSGTRLPPDRVTWIEDQPLIYVAAGSHALYFEPEAANPGSDVPTGADRHDARGRLRLGAGSTRDWVADVEPDRCLDLPSAPYELRQLPDVDGLHPGADGWVSWWWLAYGGGWGRVRPIPGPAFQGPRWDDPIGWASTLSGEHLAS
jgi:hypothetical protein